MDGQVLDMTVVKNNANFATNIFWEKSTGNVILAPTTHPLRAFHKPWLERQSLCPNSDVSAQWINFFGTMLHLMFLFSALPSTQIQSKCAKQRLTTMRRKSWKSRRAGIVFCFFWQRSCMEEKSMLKVRHWPTVCVPWPCKFLSLEYLWLLKCVFFSWNTEYWLLCAKTNCKGNRSLHCRL